MARQFRLTGSRRIGELFRTGLRVSSRRGTLLGLPNELARTRLAVAVGKHHGNAVKRNRIKRLCREAYRCVRDEMPDGWDLAFVPRARPDNTVANLAQALTALAERLAARVRRGRT